MGGFRVVYEYSNQLVARGHEVTVVHAQRVKSGPQKHLSLRQTARELRNRVFNILFTPKIGWQSIDPKVKLLYVRDTGWRHIPDGDVIFATSWNTVASVLQYKRSKGTKFYLIQHYETWLGPKDLVDQTWRSALNKVVVSKWLLSLGRELGAGRLEYIPNAVDHARYQLLQAVKDRPKQIAMMFSHVEFKGARDGIEALEIAKKKHPDLSAIFFGTGREAPWIPKWVRYYRDPPQEFIVNEIYNKSRIFLSSSWAEGFALPPAEAASCGCAIVATDSGGIADFIEDGITGLLSLPKDPKALGENLCRLLENDELRVKLAETAYRRLKSFTWDRSAEMMERFILSSNKMDASMGEHSEISVRAT
jgi:glycosyltransferase involved in cell wall biosynthesis